MGLSELKKIVLANGHPSFNVKGFWKLSKTGDVVAVVPGGTITYNKKGMVDATGDVLLLLKKEDPAVFEAGEGGRRELLALKENLKLNDGVDANTLALKTGGAGEIGRAHV